MKYAGSVYLILIAWLSFSCTDHVIYYANYHFPDKEGWNKNDTLILNLQVTDSLSANANVNLLIRNSSVYPYQNLTVAVQHNFPDTAYWRSYKVNFTLADASGKWNGAGLVGLYESSASLGGSLMASPGKYTFKISHQMNNERLTGIRDVGIMIRKKIESP